MNQNLIYFSLLTLTLCTVLNLSLNLKLLRKIKEISESLLQAKKPVIIRLDTHLSISFYFGYCLDAKYAGLDITILQKTLAGSKEWKPTLNSSSSTKVWWEREIIQVSDNEDIALSISVTKDIGQDVLEYLSNQKIGVGKVLHFKISPQPSNTVIENADQITQAVNELLIETNRNRTGKTKLGRVHIFIAAPNAFSFFMGQLAKPLGKMTLYEFDFERTKDGSYNPVISLP